MNKEFNIKCNNCGSEDVIIHEDYDYDYDDNMVGTGNFYLRCTNCGQTSEDY